METSSEVLVPGTLEVQDLIERDAGSGVTAILRWHQADGHVEVVLLKGGEEVGTIPATHENATEVFMHPMAYTDLDPWKV